MLPSWHQCVTILKEYCPPGKLTWTFGVRGFHWGLITSYLPRVLYPRKSFVHGWTGRAGYPTQTWTQYICSLNPGSFFFLSLFILRERVQVEEGKREREGERESWAGSILSVQSPMRGPIPWTVWSWPEPRSRVRRLTHWATQEPNRWFIKM